MAQLSLQPPRVKQTDAPQPRAAGAVKRMATGPIFIGGLANSGKTELRLLLEAHPNLCLTRRTKMWTRYYQRFGDLAIPANLERCLAQMLASKHIRALAPDVERIRYDFSQGEATYACLFGLFHAHHAERMGKRRWGDQLGAIEQYAVPIFSAFPTAKMIQMVRDPRHVYAEANARSPQRLGKVGWMLADWLDSVQAARRNLRNYPDRYKVIAFEALIAHPEQVTRELLEFVGEDFVPEIADALQQFTVTTAKVAEGKIAGCVGTFVRHYARRELEALGYPSEMMQLSLRDHLRYLLVEWPANRATMLARQVTHRHNV